MEVRWTAAAVNLPDGLSARPLNVSIDPRNPKRKRDFSHPQADAFAGAKAGRKSRPAPFEMRVGRGVRGRESRSLTAFGMTSRARPRDASRLPQCRRQSEAFAVTSAMDGNGCVRRQYTGCLKC